jgi:hypothetical protein
MKAIREWGFPAGLLLAWIITSVYTTSALIDAKAEHQRVFAPVAGTPHT